MKKVIKYKIIIIFTLLDIILIFLFLLNQYNSVKREKIIETQNQISKIALNPNSSFHHTQTEIINLGYIDDIQSYIGSIRELSKIVNILHISSIKSIQEINNILYVTTMSVTNKDFNAKNYPLFIKAYSQDNSYLKKILTENNMSTIVKDNNLIIPFKIKKKKYIIMATITNRDIWNNLYMIFDSISWIILILLISFVIMASIFLHVVIENQLIAIYSSLKSFFEYLKDDIKDNKKLKYIQKVSSDELGTISKLINENIKEIDIKSQTTNKEIIKDKELIEEIIRVLNLTKVGDFSNKVNIEGDNPKLNELKNIFNEMISNMNSILNKVNSAIYKYINSDFRDSIKEDKYKALLEELINNLNTLGQTFSQILVSKAKNIIKLYDNSINIDEFIKNNNIILENSLEKLNQISIEMENRSKLTLEIKHSIEVFKKENRYINNQLDTLGSQYSHLDKNDMKIIDDTIKDIRYSLYLFDKNIDKFSSYSSSLENISSTDSTKNTIDTLKNNLNNNLIKSKNIEENIKEILKLINDIKVKIIEDSDFIGKDKVKTYILYKWEVIDV